MKMTNNFYGFLLVGLLGSATPVVADSVTDWNEITVAAVTAGRPRCAAGAPPAASRCPTGRR